MPNEFIEHIIRRCDYKKYALNHMQLKQTLRMSQVLSLFCFFSCYSQIVFSWAET